MPGDADLLERIAEAVADGLPVNWEQVERESGEGIRRRLAHLRLIEKLGVAQRQAADDDGRDTSDNPFESPTLEPGTGAWPAPKHWGRLDVVRRIGRGGFGEVFRAKDPVLQNEVALKLARIDRLTDTNQQNRFLQEARRLARVKHPNVLLIHGADRFDGRVGMWTELIDGKTLESCLEEQGTFGAREAALVGIDVSCALAAMHKAGLIHRDVKTDNVMRETGGRLVLMDFSAVTESAGEKAGDDSPGGTPLFMAPELLKGKDSGAATDIYSLGVVLYRLVTGRYPVEAQSITDLVQRHYRKKPVPIRDHRPDLPAAFVEVVEKALSRDPVQRYATAGEMESALRHALGAIDESPTLGERAGIWLRRRRGAVATFAGVAAVVVVAMLVWQPWVTVLDVEADLYRTRLGSEERLESGARVAPGDKLFLEVEGSEPMHVYVLNADEAAAAYVLFPLPGMDTVNPVGARLKLRLPGTMDGRAQYWDITSAGGQETFMVVASRQAMPGLEAQVAALPRASPESGPDAVPQISRRGVGGLAPAPEHAGDPEHLLRLFRELSERARDDDGLWTWEILLDNPAP